MVYINIINYTVEGTRNYTVEGTRNYTVEGWNRTNFGNSHEFTARCITILPPQEKESIYKS
jgi:hypothetical protein